MMDGPVVPWTVGDVIRRSTSPSMFMAYHVVGSGWDVLSPVGCALGGCLYGVGLLRSYPTLWASMGTVGLVTGCGGMILGYSMMSNIASKGEAASPPWTPDGIQNRVDGLSHNFKVRVLDLSAWSGMAVASVAMLAVGGPMQVGLSKGVLGVAQGLTLGSSLGSLGAFGCIYSMKQKEAKMLKELDEE